MKDSLGRDRDRGVVLDAQTRVGIEEVNALRRNREGERSGRAPVRRGDLNDEVDVVQTAVQQPDGTEFFDEVDVAAQFAAVGQNDIFGADPGGHLPAGGERVRHGERDAADHDPARFFDHGIDQIHRRRAYEARDETRRGRAIDVLRRARLLDAPGIHDHQPIRQRHGLDLIMGDEDGGDAETVVKLSDLDAHLNPQLRVEIGERFVEEEDFRLADHGPGHRDPLPLPARKLPRLAVQEFVETDGRSDRPHPPPPLVAGRARNLEGVADVLGDRHVRIERVVLEHHGAAAFARLQHVHHPAADGDFARRDLLESRDHSQKG